MYYSGTRASRADSRRSPTGFFSSVKSRARHREGRSRHASQDQARPEAAVKKLKVYAGPNAPARGAEAAGAWPSEPAEKDTTMPAATIHGRPYGTGKRKNAIARVFLKPRRGQDHGERARPSPGLLPPRDPSHGRRAAVRRPGGDRGKFDVTATVRGGGVASQAEAAPPRHQLGRCSTWTPRTAARSRSAGFLTRDARKKERKKPGQPGARKKFQYSKR